MKKRFLSMFALLLMTVTGAWAQEETLLTTITATSTDSYSETTAGVVTVTHDNSGIYGEYGWVWWDNPGSITVEAKEGYTITRCVFKQNSKTPVTVSSAPFKVSFIETANPSHPNQKKFLCQGDWNLNMNGVSSIEVYGYAPAPAPPTYSVTLAEGTEDAGNWSVPTEAVEGSPVTVTYSGEKKVKSVKAVKKAAPAPAPVTVTINLSDWGERGQRSFTKDGVTVSADMIDPEWGELGGNITISTTLGIFTKIVVTAENCRAEGTGWSRDESTITWAGTPASTVSFRGEVVGRGSNPTTIVCTIVPTN